MEEKSEAGRRLAAYRPRVESRCIVCASSMVGTTKRRYCSTSCKLKDWRARRRTPDLYREPRDG